MGDFPRPRTSPSCPRRVRPGLRSQGVPEHHGPGACDETRLVAAIHADELTDLHLAPPEPIYWSRLAGFTYSTRSDDQIDADPRISAYLETFDGPEDLQLADLRRDRVIAVGAE